MHSKEFLNLVGKITEHARKAREAEERLRSPPRFRIMHGKLVEDPEGDVVLYADFAATKAHLETKANKAYANGKADGTPEHSWRL